MGVGGGGRGRRVKCFRHLTVFLGNLSEAELFMGAGTFFSHLSCFICGEAWASLQLKIYINTSGCRLLPALVVKIKKVNIPAGRHSDLRIVISLIRLTF